MRARGLIGTEAVRFLIAGGAAAALNWLARIGLSLVLPFAAALLLAYAIGLAAGFWLYRLFVFRGASQGALRGQLALFLAVNAAGAAVVLAVSTLTLAGLSGLMPGLDPAIAEALCHGFGIGTGAVANYVGHRMLTFGASPRPASHSL